ncbi:gastrula zinc finger protein XlCGF57.1-like [Palaemon carinicauda]|uniref:gastrula zinc finger protein XlCGF57.1-like n=1 Tax=Palaemon carinicauda TaxID=392227 RepID=UPI0035B6A076
MTDIRSIEGIEKCRHQLATAHNYCIAFENSCHFCPYYSRMEVGRLKYYDCELCDLKCKGRNDLVKHMRTHTGEKPYSCSVCGKHFSLLTNCRRHETTHSGEKRFACDICATRFTEKGSLTKHMRLHTGDDLFKCTICNRHFSQSSHLKAHVNRHIKNKELCCDICGEKFTDRLLYRSHQSSHRDTMEEDMKRNIILKPQPVREEKFICTGEKPFQCLSSSRTLATHNNIHDDGRPKHFQCPVCNKQFLQRDLLADHMQKHTGKQQHCTECNKYFTSRRSYNFHMQKHYPKAAKCSKCCKIFSAHGYLRRHLLNSTCLMKKNFICTLCNVCFASKRGLIRHVTRFHACEEEENANTLQEDDKKYFICTVCNKSFSKERSLMYHEIIVHKIVQHLNLTDAAGDLKLIRTDVGVLDEKEGSVDFQTSNESGTCETEVNTNVITCSNGAPENMKINNETHVECKPFKIKQECVRDLLDNSDEDLEKSNLCNKLNGENDTASDIWKADAVERETEPEFTERNDEFENECKIEIEEIFVIQE